MELVSDAPRAEADYSYTCQHNKEKKQELGSTHGRRAHSFERFEWVERRDMQAALAGHVRARDKRCRNCKRIERERQACRGGWERLHALSTAFAERISDRFAREPLHGSLRSLVTAILSGETQ